LPLVGLAAPHAAAGGARAHCARLSGPGAARRPRAAAALRGVAWLAGRFFQAWSRSRARGPCRRSSPRRLGQCAGRWRGAGARWPWAVARASMPPSWRRLGAASLPREWRALLLSVRAVSVPAPLPRSPPCRPSRRRVAPCPGGLAAVLRCRCSRVSQRARAQWWGRPRPGRWCSSRRRPRAGRRWRSGSRWHAACRCWRFLWAFPGRRCRCPVLGSGCRPACPGRGPVRAGGCQLKRLFLMTKARFFPCSNDTFMYNKSVFFPRQARHVKGRKRDFCMHGAWS